MMKGKKLLHNQEGFTLVEIIAVLIILGILAAVAVPRYIDLERNAADRAIDAGISELNGRESLTWADAKISNTVYADGTALNTDIVTNLMDTDLGDAYVWNGNQLRFRGGNPVPLVREDADQTTPGRWRRGP